MDYGQGEGTVQSTSATTRKATDADAERDVNREEEICMSADSMKPKASDLSISLHDCISIGEIELGLERCRTFQTIHDDSLRQEEYSRSVEEVCRLPYLLRILSSTRPLASITPFVAPNSKLKGENTVQESGDTEDENSSNNDDCLDRIVDHLEVVAATYSVAEDIDVVTNYLAPYVARNLSRLPQLYKTRVDEESYSWDTEDLVAIAQDPFTKRKRRKRGQPLHSSRKKIKHDTDDIDPRTSYSATGFEEDLLTSSDDEDQKKGNMDMAFDDQVDPRILAADDSQESTVIRTLSELVTLVVSSLDYHKKHDTEGEEEQQQHSISLNTGDILSEKTISTLTSGHPGDIGGDPIGDELSSNIVAIMHNAPVLQSRHVANALCRASVHQTGNLISRLGANSPASVPSLLLGCIEAYSMSLEYHHRGKNDGLRSTIARDSKSNLSCPIVTAAKSAIVALARLSPRESYRVQNKLQSLGIMIDLQLKLALEKVTLPPSGNKVDIGIVSVACLLIDHLSITALTKLETGSLNLFTSNSTSIDDIPVEEKMESEATETKRANNIDSVFDYATASSKGGEPSLLLHFLLNPDLYTQSLDFFSQNMKVGKSEDIGKSLGKWSLLVRSFAVVLLVPLPRAKTGFDSDSYSTCKTCINSFEGLVRNLDHAYEMKTNDADIHRPKTSKMDTFVGILSSCAILLLSWNLAIENKQGNVETGKTAQTIEIMKTVFKILRSTSEQTNKLRISIEDQLQKQDTTGMFERTLYPLNIAFNIQEGYAKHSYISKQGGLVEFCKVMRPTNGATKEEIELNISFDIPFRLHALRSGLDSPSESLLAVTKEILRHILEGEDDGENVVLMKNVQSAQFVVEATNAVVKQGSSEIPFVLQAHIDKSWSIMASDWKALNVKPTDGRKYNFILRLVYSFIFLDKSPLSPFVFDPRSSPIKELLFMIQNIPSKSTRSYLLSEIQVLIRKHCPELILCQSKEYLDLGMYSFFDTMDRKSILAALCRSIRADLRDNNSQHCGNSTEYLFLLAKSRICDSDVISVVTNTLLSSSHSPSPAYSYYLLCRDPIVCLKFSLCVWKCRNLRRIALSVLENLLASNNAITLAKSRHRDTAFELLAARDSIVVRCLLAVLHGGDSKSLLICSMTTSFIRWIIQSHSGLVALMVKQGLRERDLDWLVENVPETMNDSQYLLQVFSDRNNMTAAERLVVADSTVRIAIVHGKTNEAAASQLIFTAVSQLVDSFYLILGPVGLLPIDALFNADSGTPITQTSQKAAFRILNALSKLRGPARYHFQKDCNIVLQKLINLCKVELQGAVVGRRKQLVKELYDATIKLEK